MSTNFQWSGTGASFTNLTASWQEFSIKVNGARISTNAYGKPMLIELKRNAPNTPDYNSFVDWIKIEAYNPWADYVDDEGLGTYDRTAHSDTDGVDNFTEWAFGGDPLDSGDRGLSSTIGIVDMGADGTNEVIVITPRQTNYWENGVDYVFDENEDLSFSAAWTNVWPWEWKPVDEGGYNAEFDAVTNIFSGAVLSNDTYFIRIRADHRDYNP